jgi:hypothetical protein
MLPKSSLKENSFYPVIEGNMTEALLLHMTEEQ